MHVRCLAAEAHTGTYVGKESDEGILAQKRALAAHISACNEPDSLRLEVAIVRYKVGCSLACRNHCMPSSPHVQNRLIAQHRARIPLLRYRSL